MNHYINQAEEALLHTYNRYQIVLEKGEGVYLYDTEGKQYLDFAFALKNGTEPAVRGEEGLQSLRLIEAIYQSSDENRTVIL